MDLVWLRMIAVGSPNFYRWIEEYLVEFVALASGRAHVSDQERESAARKMDAALMLDGLDWEEQQFEIERHLPGIQPHTINKGKDERLFSRTKVASHLRDAKDKRLASPSHSRIYFTLIDPPEVVTDLDIAELLTAARDGANAVAYLLMKMGEHRGDAGGTKAERLLDQLRYVEQDILQTWPVEALVMGLANAADELAKDARGDDWGYPRIWYLARALLRRLRETIPADRFDKTLSGMFEASQSLGFLSYLLRDETFGHGIYGDRPDPNDRLSSRAGFEHIREVMIARYAAGGLGTVMAEPRATDMLYAWSQAGARDDIIARVAAHSADDAWLLKFIQLLYRPNSSLSFDALANFFSAPAAIVRRIQRIAETDPGYAYARDIIRSLKDNIRFDGGDFEEVIEAWEARGPEDKGISDDGAAADADHP